MMDDATADHFDQRQVSAPIKGAGIKKLKDMRRESLILVLT
jgi:hypothetical protein